VRVPGLTAERRRHNLEMLRWISNTAAEYGIDFTLGIWEHNAQTNQTPTVEGLNRQNIGPYSYAALRKVLAACPKIRSVQMRTNSESGIPSDQQVEFYRDYVYRALRDAGRRITLDLRGWVMAPEMLQAALQSGVPVRLSSKYWGEHIGRPYQPAETWPNYSYIDFLRRSRSYQFYWEVWGLGSHRVLLWGDPDFVRRAVPTFTLSDSIGFEIDPPLAQKGYGNRPGKWQIPTPGRYEFERYWLFYLLWGRLSFDPKTSEKVWAAEFERRFGKAAQAVLDAYRSSSRAVSEIVAAHLADPNMYIWPEISPGSLIDGYKEIRPSDWRFIASIPEAIKNRIDGLASAKQTPFDTAAILDDAASATEQAVGRASAAVGAGNREWQTSEPDFRALALLARYHARKQIAADQLTYFYETGDPSGLERAQKQIQEAVVVWEQLVKLTDGFFPDEMAFGPEDQGHWKHKLPYVRYDLKMLSYREQIYRQFGRFDYGFDFGGPLPQPGSYNYRNDWYVVNSTLEPRFQPVDPETRYSEQRGYGWTGEGKREAVPLTPVPFAEIRALLPQPKHLPRNTLFGDSITGEGPQTFRIRSGDGVFTVLMLTPDGRVSQREITARNGTLDVVFPQGFWQVSGLIVKGSNTHNTVPQLIPADRPPRPTISHTAPKTALAGSPLHLLLSVQPRNSLKSLRLHYRPLNHLAKFKTLEQPPSYTTFTIPGSDISAEFDLLYYFEILNTQNTGWFEPDPMKATPYFVVRVEPNP